MSDDTWIFAFLRLIHFMSFVIRRTHRHNTYFWFSWLKVLLQYFTSISMGTDNMLKMNQQKRIKNQIKIMLTALTQVNNMYTVVFIFACIFFGKRTAFKKTTTYNNKVFAVTSDQLNVNEAADTVSLNRMERISSIWLLMTSRQIQSF